MQDTDVPAKFPIPFGNAAGPTMIRPIPVASQIGTNPGAASLTDGFVPLNAQPIEAGGIPPDVRDMNGILDQVTAWARWHSAGGPNFWDSSFSTAIGGYPLGSVVASNTTAGRFWESTVDNNTTNPDTGGAGWVPLLSSTIQSMAYNTATDTGGVNAITISLSPAPASLAAIKGALISIIPAHANTGAATLNVNGLGAKPIVNIDRSGLAASQIIGGMIVVVWDGTNFTLVSGSRYMPNGTSNGQVVTYDQFNHQFDVGGAVTGYQQLPGGYLEQWGIGTVTSGVNNFNFPTTFPVECFSVICQEWNPTLSTWGNNFPTLYASASAPGQTAFVVFGVSWTGSGWTLQTGGTFRWRAIGR